MKRGAKLKLDDEMIEKISKLIEEGNFDIVVCKAVGIAPKTLYNWLNRGRRGDGGVYKKLLDAYEKAEAKAEMRALELVKSHSLLDPKYATWFLERRFPERWALKGVNFTGNVKIELETISKKQIEELLAKYGSSEGVSE